jgi:hypothetical protein
MSCLSINSPAYCVLNGKNVLANGTVFALQTGSKATVKELLATVKAWLQTSLAVPLCRFNSC